jgi:hypothetical protein
MFRDQPSLPLGPIGVGLSSLTRRQCRSLLMMAPIGGGAIEGLLPDPPIR